MGYGLYNRSASLNTFYEGRESVGGDFFLLGTGIVIFSIQHPLLLLARFCALIGNQIVPAV